MVAKLLKFRQSDAIGAIASTLCALHCAALPVLASLPVVAGGWLASHPVEMVFVGIAASVAFISIIKNYRINGLHYIQGVFAAGIALIIADLLINHDNHRFLSIGGGITLVVAHIMNNRICKMDHSPQSETETDEQVPEDSLEFKMISPSAR